MLGVRVESSFSRQIKKDVASFEGVEGAFDLVLNDYGPDKYLGSIHIEVKDTLTVSEVDKISRLITKKIIDKYGVILHTVGIYSVNTKDKNAIKVKKDIKDIVFSNAGVKEMHGFYIDEVDKSISFDIIIDFNTKNIEDIYAKIYDEVKAKYKDYKLTITLDIDISD